MIWFVVIGIINIAIKTDTSILNLQPEINDHISILGEQSMRHMLFKHLSYIAFYRSSC